MADADKTLEVFLKLTAQTDAAVAQTKAALKEVETQAASTAATVNAVSGTVDYEKLAQERAAATAAVNAEEIAGAEAVAAAQEAQQERIALQMERRVAMELQLEAAEARIAGDAAGAVRLEREADIRMRSLGIQRSLNVSTEEAIVLAERLVLAEEAQAAPTLLAGANLNKAKGEAITLARELATGSVNARTMGAFLGSFGSALTIAALAGYELYKLITAYGDESVKFSAELIKQNQELAKAEGQWTTLAREAKDFGDVVKLGEKIGPTLELMHQKMEEFRKQELAWWQTWADAIIHQLGSAIPGHGPTPFADKKAADDKARADDLDAATVRANADTDKAIDETNRYAAAQNDLNKGIKDYSASVAKLKSERDGLDAARRSARGNDAVYAEWKEKARQYEDEKGKLDELNAKQEKLNKSTSGEKALRSEVNTTLRDQANLLAQIRGNQQAVQQNPFMSADQKNAAMIPLITQEMRALAAQTQQDVAEQKKLTDPAQWTQMQGKIQAAGRELAKLGIQLKTLSFSGSIRAELTAWINQVGSTSKQVAGFITSSLNTAISGAANAITGLITGTKNWGQAFAQVGTSIIEQLVQLGIQMIVTNTIGRFLTRSNTQEQSQAGAQIAAAHAPAAAATSISSYGSAAVVGGIAAAAAIALIIGLLAAGSFESGGYTGGREGAAAGVVHGREYVFSAPRTQALGVPLLEGLHKGTISIAGYERGGFVSPSSTAASIGSSSSTSSGRRGGGDVHIYPFIDLKKMQRHILQNPGGRKILIDIINGSRHEIGLR